MQPYDAIASHRRQPSADDVERVKQVLASVLRQARVAKCWTQEDVAHQIGVTLEFYGRIERGYLMPGLQNMIRLADLFRLEADVLIGLKPMSHLALTPDEIPQRVRKLERRIRRLSEPRQRVIARLMRALDAAQRARTAQPAGEPR